MARSLAPTRKTAMPRRVPDRWRIAADLRQKIADGTYPPGSRLPTIRELAETYDVSEEPVRTALRTLEDEGWTEGQQGKGVFVSARPPSVSGE